MVTSSRRPIHGIAILFCAALFVASCSTSPATTNAPEVLGIDVEIPVEPTPDERSSASGERDQETHADDFDTSPDASESTDWDEQDSAVVERAVIDTEVGARGDARHPYAAAGSEPDSTPARPATLRATECRFNAADRLAIRPECFDLVVPERRGADDSATVRVHTAVFRSSADDPLQDPVIYLEGGPGGHALDMLPFTFVSLVEPYVGERDVIVFDQRGAGRSEPALGCPEAIESDAINARVVETPAREDARSLRALTACAKRLRNAGHDLASFNSVESAHDLAALIDLLGYSKVNLLGISYGTRLAQTMMRLHPEMLRSVVLDSVVPMHGSVLTKLPSTAEQAVAHLFANCARDAACNDAYPNLNDRLTSAMELLDHTPIRYEATDLLSGELVDRIADGDDLLGLIFNALYSQSSFSVVPQLIHEVEQAETGVLSALGSQQVTQADLFSVGMYFAVTCHEEAPFEEVPASPPTDDRFASLGRHMAGSGFHGTCDAWDLTAASEIEDAAIRSEVPTLILGGAYDPITPISGGQAVSEDLDTSHLVVFPHEGHGPGVTSCGATVVARFFDAPRGMPAHECVDDTPPTFVPEPITAPVTMVDFAAEGTGVRLSGIRPEAWTDLGSGQFARNQNLVDPTMLLFQNTFGTPTSELVAGYGAALGLAEPFAGGPQLWDERGAWLTFTGISESDTITVAVREAGFDGLAIVLIAPSDEHDALVEYVLAPAAQSAAG